MDKTTATGSNPGKYFDAGRERVFDCMAPHWDGMAPPVPPEKIRELIDIADVKGKTVLDVGAGTGILVEAGLSAGARRWIACDLSGEWLIPRNCTALPRFGRQEVIKMDQASEALWLSGIRVISHDGQYARRLADRAFFLRRSDIKEGS